MTLNKKLLVTLESYMIDFQLQKTSVQNINIEDQESLDEMVEWACTPVNTYHLQPLYMKPKKLTQGQRKLADLVDFCLLKCINP